VVGPAPNDAEIEKQGFGWANSHGTGKGVDSITSGLEGAWTSNPTKWDNGYFHNLFEYEWELGKGAGGANQWYPKDGAGANDVPDAHAEGVTHPPTMFTTDVALKEDPIYREISERFHKNPEEFKEAFAKAWYKLTHRAS
jgi:catalase-peroxidase